MSTTPASKKDAHESKPTNLTYKCVPCNRKAASEEAMQISFRAKIVNCNTGNLK